MAYSLRGENDGGEKRLSFDEIHAWLYVSISTNTRR